MRESKASGSYAASCDKLHDYLFFEGQYKKRCFLKDNFKEYEVAFHRYNEFFNNIKEILYRYMTIDPDDDFQPFFNVENQINERIKQLQIFYSCMCNSYMYDIYRNMIYQNNFCSHFYEYNSCSEIVCKFCMLSEKYGLFINDIFSKFEIEKISSLDTQIDISKIYKPYPDISGMNKYFKNEEYMSMNNIKKKRFYNTVDKMSSGRELTRPEKSLANKSLKTSVVSAWYKRSYTSRRIGLCIWDNCVNPLNKNKITLEKVIGELYHSNVGVSFGKEDFNRSMKRILNNTIECIDKRSLVPFKE